MDTMKEIELQSNGMGELFYDATRLIDFES